MLAFFIERFVSISFIEQPFFLHQMTLFLCQESVFVCAVYCWDLCFVLSMHCLFENYNTLLTIVTSNKTLCEGEVLVMQLLLYKNAFYFSKSFCNSTCFLESLCQFQQKNLGGVLFGRVLSLQMDFGDGLLTILSLLLACG